MSEVTRILSALEQGDTQAADQLLPLVYDELRKLAAQHLAQEKPGQTLQPTALVHEAYLRLVGDGGKEPHWHGRRHFVAAAAEAMRRILIDNARQKGRLKRGGNRRRVDLDVEPATVADPGETLIIDEALCRLEAEDADAAQLVKLRYFAGLSVEQAAEALGMSRSTAYENWAYARAWLHREVYGQADPS